MVREMRKLKNNYIVNIFLTILLSVSISYASPRLDLSWVQSWAMQLQDPDIEKLRASPYDLLVIDYSKDGTDDQAFKSSDIKILKNQGKLVFSYLSIGEVEDYRFYWNDDWGVGYPSFIGSENPDWVGNYKVKYWEKDYWKQVLRPYLKKITSAGFQGVYLDVVDAYWYWAEKDGSHKDKAIKMFKLIKKIQRYANKKTGGNFAICPQNGLAILDDLPPKKRTAYLNIIDCVGVESLYYNVYSQEDQDYRMKLIENVHQANKPIFNVEYIPEDEYYNHEQLYLNSPMRIIGYPANPNRELNDLIDL
jgi:cysteinyl-tRNA synthetase